MADNPIMLRLKELEALETIAGKVERLTVHNGTGGLLNDLVKLREALTDLSTREEPPGDRRPFSWQEKAIEQPVNEPLRD